MVDDLDRYRDQLIRLASLQRKMIDNENLILKEIFDMVDITKDAIRLLEEGKPFRRKWFVERQTRLLQILNATYFGKDAQ